MDNKKYWRYLCLSTEAVQGKGEDAFLLVERKGITLLGVFDGCGGLGSRKYPQVENRTSANIAANTAAAALDLWFEQNAANAASDMQQDTRKLAAQIKESIDRWMQSIRRQIDREQATLFGSLIRSFPTTAAVALVEQPGKNRTVCRFIWAGDSRGYVWNPLGLFQCTADDLRFDGDAFDNLYEDASLSNLVSGDSAYELHTNRVALTVPSVVLTASDGMFSYLPSPMHFEWMLLRALCRAKNPEGWNRNLREEIAAVTADDSTVCMKVCGWNSFAEMKKSFAPRYARLSAMLEKAADRQTLQTLWQSYKPDYESYLESR